MGAQERYTLTGSGPESYERDQVPGLFGPLAELLLTAVPLRNEERVLDVACGTGIVARLAAEQIGITGLVTGVDLNPSMLKVAEENTPSGTKIEWLEGDAGKLPCEDVSYDVVLCQQGLQYFPDKPKALREMHRVLMPGGRVALSVWRSIEHVPFNQAVIAGITRFVGDEIATRMLTPYALGDVTVLQNLLTVAGFREVKVETIVFNRHMLPPEVSVLQYLASTPVAQTVAELDEDIRSALVSNISQALNKYRVQDGLSLPQEAYVAMALK